MPLGLAVAQLDAVLLDPEANAAAGARAIGKAAAAGAALVVLPELFLSGYVLRPELQDAAEPADGSGGGLTAWREAARRHAVAVVAGFCERDGARLYNAAVAIDAAGEIRGVYRKLHLFDREREVLSSGDRGLPVVDLGSFRVGMLICYDLRFPEAMRILALRGADVVAVPSAWVATFNTGPPTMSGAPAQVEATLAQAGLNQVLVVVADRVGDDEGVLFLGRSVVASPFGTPLLGPLSAEEAGVAVVQIELSTLADARFRAGRIDPRNDRRVDVYADLLGYDAPF